MESCRRVGSGSEKVSTQMAAWRAHAAWPFRPAMFVCAWVPARWAGLRQGAPLARQGNHTRNGLGRVARGVDPIGMSCGQCHVGVMRTILILIVMLLLLGGGGFYWGGPAYGGGGIGLV